MCDDCRDFNEKKYPDLGSGSMLSPELHETGMNADAELGLRIWQTRKVSYMGPEGVESREEVECIYLPWHSIISQVLPDMMELYSRACPMSQQLLDMALVAKKMEERYRDDE